MDGSMTRTKGMTNKSKVKLKPSSKDSVVFFSCENDSGNANYRTTISDCSYEEEPRIKDFFTIDNLPKGVQLSEMVGAISDICESSIPVVF